MPSACCGRVPVFGVRFPLQVANSYRKQSLDDSAAALLAHRAIDAHRTRGVLLSTVPALRTRTCLCPRLYASPPCPGGHLGKLSARSNL